MILKALTYFSGLRAALKAEVRKETEKRVHVRTTTIP